MKKKADKAECLRHLRAFFQGRFEVTVLPPSCYLRPMEPCLRRARAADGAALYDICLRTGDSGRDAAGLIADPRFLGDLFVGPYLVFEPMLAWVVEDEEGPGGYLVGVADTEAFQAWAGRAWWPRVVSSVGSLEGGSALQQGCLAYLQDCQAFPGLPAVLQAYPAHLHMNMLPRLQGRGLGRKLLAGFLEALRHRGVSGAHWGVWHENPGAMAFYRRMGAQVLAREDWGVTFGCRA